MRTRLGVRRESPIPRLGDRGQRLGGRQMHDVEGRVGQLGQPDGSVRRLPFHQRGAGDGVIFRCRVVLGDGLLDQHLDHRAVLGMDADHAALSPGDPHRSEQGAVVHHQHSRIGREQLEARHPLPVDERLHVGERLAGDVENDHVGGDVHARALRPAVPVVESRAQTLPTGLVGEVHESGGAAEGGRPGSSSERVDRAGGTEIPIEMRVNVDPPGQHQQTAGVVDADVPTDRDVPADHPHSAVLDEDIGPVVVGRGHDPSVPDQHRFHVHLLYLTASRRKARRDRSMAGAGSLRTMRTRWLRRSAVGHRGREVGGCTR